MGETWLAEYEEGYVSGTGKWITVDSWVTDKHPWDSPAAAVLAWERNKEFDRPTVSKYGNGKQEIDDVGSRSEFVRLDVAKIWRRITFLPISPDSSSGS